MTFILDGKVAASRYSDQANLSKTFILHVAAGSYGHSIQGSYGYYDPVGGLQRPPRQPRGDNPK